MMSRSVGDNELHIGIVDCVICSDKCCTGDKPTEPARLSAPGGDW